MIKEDNRRGRRCGNSEAQHRNAIGDRKIAYKTFFCFEFLCISHHSIVGPGMINFLFVKGYATLREAKLAESSNDKVVMWTGGSYDYEDVAPALVRLDRAEMRPGTSGQYCKTVPTHLTDLKRMSRQLLQVPRI